MGLVGAQHGLGTGAVSGDRGLRFRPVTAQEAARTIRTEGIDCVYSLFQAYRPKLWGPKATGVEHDVWTLLRGLLRERADGVFDVPILRHWGFDVHNLDANVARAMDGHLFCNREKFDYFSTPISEGGRGLDFFAKDESPRFIGERDRPDSSS